jgi:hypothetical protein
MKALFVTVVFISALTSVINPVLGQGLAFVSNTNAVGNGPSSVIAVDIKGDGKLDLVCTDSKDNTLTVLTNDGSGGFVSNATYSVPGVNPACVTAADINGNGKPDLVAALFNNNNGPGELVVLTNDGSGGFVSNATYTVGFGPSCVVAVDVNGDGKIDLVTANGSVPPGGLTVLTNDGSGGFVLDATLGTENFFTQSHWVAAADIKGDGKVDLISANIESPANTLTVFTNDGSGDFGSNATYIVGLLPQCVVAADINGDGKPDLITANTSGTLTVLTNNGSGSFVSNATYSVGTGAFFVTAADINGDGKLDLICANLITNTLTVLTNDGSGGFVFCTTLTVGDGPRSIAVADLNGDGKLDLISANYNDNTLTVLTQVTPPPELTIASVSPDAVAVSWPSSTTNFVLQTNADLTTTNWGIPNYAISTTGQVESVTISPLPSENLFFRLMSQ